MTIIIDAHEDLAYSALTFGRDYTQSAASIRQFEQGTFIPSVNGHTMLGWQEYQQGKVAIIFATLFITPERYKEGEWDVICYHTFDQAHELYWQEIDYYRKLCEGHPEKFQPVFNQQDLQTVLSCWKRSQSSEAGNTITCPTGLVMLMENAEGIRRPREMEEYWEAGVRIVGPVWAGERFCGGSMEGEGFTKEGYELLETMAELGFALDVSHMNEISTLQALDTYE
ncbi:MAG: membrane dipeptidase, partial [Anaerolineales bacterium]